MKNFKYDDIKLDGHTNHHKCDPYIIGCRCDDTGQITDIMIDNDNKNILLFDNVDTYIQRLDIEEVGDDRYQYDIIYMYICPNCNDYILIHNTKMVDIHMCEGGVIQ